MRVLLANDPLAYREAMSVALGRAGFEVRVVEADSSLESNLHGFRPDVVVLSASEKRAERLSLRSAVVNLTYEEGERISQYVYGQKLAERNLGGLADLEAGIIEFANTTAGQIGA